MNVIQYPARFIYQLCRLPPRSLLVSKRWFIMVKESSLNSEIVAPQTQQVRTFKSELKIKWVRPPKIPCIDPSKSGDLKPIDQVNESEPILELKQSEELKEADELVKKIFSLQFFPRKKSTEIIRKNMITSVQRHQQDFKSSEAKIAQMTSTIRSFQELMSKFPHNRRMKVSLKELIDKRKKYLKFLRQNDYKKFEWLLEKLDLVYRPPPSHFHWITRKESLVKLTDKYCEDIKVKRLEAYRETLEAQKIDFLSEKIKKLKWIQGEEIACGVEPTVRQEDIDEVIRQLEDLKVQKGISSKVNEAS